MATAAENIPGAVSEMSPSVGPLLARANLLRMRGQWDEAIAACAEALRYAPNSATAHALLGDIYEEQGKFDDALQWFSMAVDLAPDNATDRAKFERLLAIQRAKLVAEKQVGAQSPKAAKEKTLDWIDRKFPPGRSESIARLIWAMSGVMAFLILGCAGFLYLLSRNNGSAAKGNFPNAPLEVKNPVVIAPPAVGISVVPPSIVAPATRPTPQPITSSLSTTPNTLRDKIAAQTREITVLSAQLDLATQQVSLAIAVPARREAAESVDQLRERIVRSAAATARSAAQIEMRATTAHVAVSLSGRATDSASPVFVGTIPLEETRKTDFATAATGEILGRFTQLQWTLPNAPEAEVTPQLSATPSSTTPRP